MKEDENISSYISRNENKDKDKDREISKENFSESENSNLGKFRRNSFLGNKKIASRLPVTNIQNPSNSNPLNSSINTNLNSTLPSNSLNNNNNNNNNNNSTNSINYKEKDREREKDEIIIKDEINWVECSRCSKWRKVPRNIKGDKFN